MQPSLERALQVRRHTARGGGGGGYPDGLSEREIEVLRLVNQGRSNREIARELVISIRTVERHLANAFAKTGTANRGSAAAHLRQRGLL